MSENIFPWQASQWQLLWQARNQNRLPHALLLAGIAGLGKKQFAQTFARSLMCHAPDSNGGVCGQCRSCDLFNAKFHPDLLMIEPEETGQMIKIDQIRELVEFVNETAQQGGYRIIIIDPATSMNVNAGNALLKSLEEPSSNCLFILISNQSLRLLPTIKSRCQEIAFSKPDKTMAMNWLHSQNKDLSANAELLLHLSYGAPLKALELSEGEFLKVRQDLYQGLLALNKKQEDPLQVAARLQEMNVLLLFGLMQSWLRDLLLCKVTEGDDQLRNIDFHDNVMQLTKTISLKKLLRYVDWVQQVYARLSGSINLNRQLVLEELFIEWVKI